MSLRSNDDIFGPKSISFSDIGITTLGAIVSGFIGSVLLIFVVFIVSGFIDIPERINSLASATGFDNISPLFPLLLAFMSFIVLLIVSIVTYMFLHISNNDRYKKTHIHYVQISVYSFLLFLCFVPIYVYIGLHESTWIMSVFVVHVLLSAFGTIIIVEILNNYRYILLEIYACFIGFFMSGMMTTLIFSFFPLGTAKLIAILTMIPLSYGLIILFKGLFEWLYYQYFKLSGYDQLGDIFRQIEMEESDELAQAIDENNI